MANNFKSRAAELKPRERIEAAGTAAVASAAELLAVILKTGAAGCDVMELAQRLIDAFGGVAELVRADLNTLKSTVADYNRRNPERRIVGLGKVKRLELAAAFELARRGYAAKKDARKAITSSADAAAAFRLVLRQNAERETFWALPLDMKRRPLSEPQVVSIGTANGVSVHPRDVFSFAVKWNAISVVVAHNHPSGNPAPSRHDIELTEGIAAAGKVVGIPLIDHIILSETSHYSFADAGKLPTSVNL